ncbi:MAG TPA: PKD domain-containing protein [Spongiibacteraceae bacterium]|nr:PKD domain-containing protein [Spongiibacteraceae bacterium]
MNANGSWKVTLATKLGAQDLQLHIETRDNNFTGHIESPMGNIDIEGDIDGDTLRWDMKISKPISMKASYEVSIDGDAMSGTARLGFLGKAKVTGSRIATSTSTSSTEQKSAPEFVTEDSIDPQYNDPYIDVNELRNEPVPHRYVHGGFKNTGARFSFYFPPAEQYQRRFFHNTYPLALSEDIGPFPIAFDVATGNLGFTLDSGAYYVQTNLGGSDRTPMADPAIAAYRVNAAAAKYSRIVARELYGEHRPYGYLFGGSGGSYQTIGSAENTRGVWDGFVPFVMAVPNAVPSMFTVRMHALRVLNQRNKFPAIMDAINPGGSRDPYEELNEEECAALREASLMGFPLRGWYAYETIGSGYFNHVAPLVPMLDPTYNEDFWSKPGYLGTDPNSTIRAERFHFDTTVTNVIDDFFKFVELEAVPERNFANSHLVILSGASAGNSIPIATIDGKKLGFTLSADQAAIGSIRAGDKVRIDNSWALAMQTYHRHQVPTPDMVGWNQFRGADGKPIYPQRDILIGPLSAAGTAGSMPNGNIHGKVLVLECLMDIDALPWQADWYRAQVKEKLGDRSPSEPVENNFALWFIDHAHHDDPAAGKPQAHAVSFAGALQQALRDVSTWVEKGVRPADTRYEVIDTQVKVPAAAKQRGGIQPVAELKANGSVRTDVKTAEAVTFTADIEVPPNAGSIVAAEWDFEGAGDYPVKQTFDSQQTQMRLSATHAYAKPGTYFAVIRFTSQRQGNAQTSYGRIQNIARVRVVVE